MLLEIVEKNAQERMAKALDNLRSELSKLRTGRAHPSLIDHIKVPCYGSDMPLQQVASVNAKDARTLTIAPWDKNLIPAIEKAILQADLGLNPTTSGNTIIVPLPLLTEERRKELVKLVKATTENIRIEIRNIRRDANESIKKSLKDKQITEDEEHRAQEHIQKLTDNFIAEADKIAAAKEKDLMEI